MGEIKTPEQVIADYRAAYEATHGRPLSERITYQRGWYRFCGWPGRTVRRFHLEQWTDRLRAREGGHHD